MKSILVYTITFLMFTTSALYILVAIFGESIETYEARELQLVEGQGEETEPGHNENGEVAVSEMQNESTEALIQLLKEQQLEQTFNESKNIEGTEAEAGPHEESFAESQRKMLEFPLSVSAGIGYAATGLWTILDKRNSKIPYIVAIVGSLILLGIYFASRTIGIPSLGTEPIGLLDSIVAGLQVAIIATSLYILIGKEYTTGKTNDK